MKFAATLLFLLAAARNTLNDKLLTSVLTALSCIFFFGRSQSNLGTRSSTGEIEKFDGLITEDSFDKFLMNFKSRHVSKIIINSPGGKPISAMKFGRWILDNAASVQVIKVCLSC